MPSTVGYWPNLTATVVFGQAALTDGEKKIDIQENDIQSVEWVSVDGNTNAIRYEDVPNNAPPNELPEMPNWEGSGGQGSSSPEGAGDAPAGNAGGKRCFPEKLNPNATKAENEINVKVTLAQEVKGMNATVHIDYFDPGPRVTKDIWENPDDTMAAYASGKCNNNGDFQIEDNTLSFATGSREKLSKCTFTKAQPGDDYIIAAHPNQGSLSQYLISINDLYKIVYPKNEGEWSFLPTSLHTSTLTVWRTLWLEIDQMAMPQATIEDGFDPNYLHPNSKTCSCELGKPWWGEENFVCNDIKPHTLYDVRFQPSISDEDLAVLVNAMQAACVDVRKVEQTPENVHWRKGAAHTRGEWVTVIPFIHNINEGQMINTINAGRDIFVQDHFFWCILMIAAYEYGEKNIRGNIINGDGDDNFPHETLPGEFINCPICGDNPTRNVDEHGVAQTQATVFIFCETIRDVPSGERAMYDRYNKPLKTRDKETLKRGTIFHEVLHCFGLRDDGDGIMKSPGNLSDPNITGNVYWYNLGFVEPWDILLPKHIEAVQKTDYPK